MVAFLEGVVRWFAFLVMMFVSSLRSPLVARLENICWDESRVSGASLLFAALLMAYLMKSGARQMLFVVTAPTTLVIRKGAVRSLFRLK